MHERSCASILQTFSDPDDHMTIHDNPDFGRFLDGDLPHEREPELLRLVAGDPEARAILRQELLFRRSLGHAGALTSRAVPAGFTERVMDRVRSAGAPSHESPPALRLVRTSPILRNTMRVTALAAALLAGVLLGIAFNQPASLVNDTSTPARLASAADAQEVWVRFYHTDPNAASVAIIGDFSDWEPVALTEHALGGTTVWTGLVRVPRGEHRYMFLIDGETLVTDPLAPLQQDDGFGNRNVLLAL